MEAIRYARLASPPRVRAGEGGAEELDGSCDLLRQGSSPAQHPVAGHREPAPEGRLLGLSMDSPLCVALTALLNIKAVS